MSGTAAAAQAAAARAAVARPPGEWAVGGAVRCGGGSVRGHANREAHAKLTSTRVGGVTGCRGQGGRAFDGAVGSTDLEAAALPADGANGGRSGGGNGGAVIRSELRVIVGALLNGGSLLLSAVVLLLHLPRCASMLLPLMVLLLHLRFEPIL